jgi:hypothetical protein
MGGKLSVHRLFWNIIMIELKLMADELSGYFQLYLMI